ncbi:hypothetical protein Tco_1314603 [Tanacetum coccineum]
MTPFPDTVPSTNVGQMNLWEETFFSTLPSCLESKLKARRRNVVVSKSDNEEAEEHDRTFPPGLIYFTTTAFGSETDVPTRSSFGCFLIAGPFNKGKIVPHTRRRGRSFQSRAHPPPPPPPSILSPPDSIGGGQMDDDWIRIMGQVHANQGLTADLLGPDVTEENFAERMVKVIAERRRQFETQSVPVIYSTGWTLKHVKSFTDATLQEEFNKIRHAVENLQTQILRRSIKRPGADLDQPTSKKSKSNEAQNTSVPPASNPSTAGVPSKPFPPPFVLLITPPHSPEVTPVSPPKPSDAAPSAAAPSNASSHQHYTLNQNNHPP